ncbi:hypothetical protein BaRGS_00017126, partial [Batillaria attramentaria]
ALGAVWSAARPHPDQCAFIIFQVQPESNAAALLLRTKCLRVSGLGTEQFQGQNGELEPHPRDGLTADNGPKSRKGLAAAGFICRAELERNRTPTDVHETADYVGESGDNYIYLETGLEIWVTQWVACQVIWFQWRASQPHAGYRTVAINISVSLSDCPVLSELAGDGTKGMTPSVTVELSLRLSV